MIMVLSFLRVFFIVSMGLFGYYIGSLLHSPDIGWMVGVLTGLVIIFLEQRLHNVSLRGLSSMVFGLLLGFFMAKIMSDIISLVPLGDFVHSVSRVGLTLVFSYLGAIIALRGKDEFNIVIPYIRFQRQNAPADLFILDTSVIIDGRVPDIYKTNFLYGRLVVPRFVLKELQQLADSRDDLKRDKGRRGLDLLRLMQEDPRVDIRVHEDEFLEEEGVDDKLIRLARILDARLLTTDDNLTKMAILQGVTVLNIHALAGAVRLAVTTGDVLSLDLVKRGKERHQGVGYLGDGTMVVVSDAADCVGRQVRARVTSVLQTASGKIIFAQLCGQKQTVRRTGK